MRQNFKIERDYALRELERDFEPGSIRQKQFLAGRNPRLGKKAAAKGKSPKNAPFSISFKMNMKRAFG